jgi:hypothetical protein
MIEPCRKHCAMERINCQIASATNKNRPALSPFLGHNKEIFMIRMGVLKI